MHTNVTDNAVNPPAFCWCVLPSFRRRCAKKDVHAFRLIHLHWRCPYIIRRKCWAHAAYCSIKSDNVQSSQTHAHTLCVLATCVVWRNVPASCWCSQAVGRLTRINRDGRTQLRILLLAVNRFPKAVSLIKHKLQTLPIEDSALACTPRPAHGCQHQQQQAVTATAASASSTVFETRGGTEHSTHVGKFAVQQQCWILASSVPWTREPWCVALWSPSVGIDMMVVQCSGPVTAAATLLLKCAHTIARCMRVFVYYCTI